jgi:signal transduction histidine kinase
VTQETASAILVLELTQSILLAPDLAGGFHLLFQKLAAPFGFPRALALAERRGELRAVATHGVDSDAIGPVAIPLSDAAHPVVAALRGSGSFAAIDDPGIGIGPAILIPIRRADGHAFAALVAASPASSESTESTGAARLASDVGRVAPALHALWEREELRGALAAAERRRDVLKGICGALPDPVVVTDANGAIVLDNRRARELLFAEDGEEGPRARHVHVNHHLFSSFLAHPPPEGPFGTRELTLVEPGSGDALRFEVLLAPLPEAYADAGASVWLLHDVTALKEASTALEHQFRKARRAETQVRRERDRLDLILANVGAPILVTDDRAEVVLMNREAGRLFEARADQADDAPANREAAGNEARFATFVADFAQSTDRSRTAKIALVDPETGAAFPAEIVSGKILTDKGALQAVVSVFHDQSREVEIERLAAELAGANEHLEERVQSAVAELAERNRRLEWQQQELERAYRLKSEFLASMSHELRTPINALLGYASLMRDGLYGELTRRQDEALARMYVASEHLLDLVNDILDLAKIEAGKMPVHVEPVELPDLLREVSEAVEPLVKRKGLAYAVEVGGELPVLETDRTRVKQVLLNLLSNAVKFTPRGEVRLHARVAGGGVEVAVADTGIGIPPDQLDAIWDDFRQVDQSSTREYGGTGLGLSIVRKLLALLGGSVRVESQVGRGSTFIVTLPLRSRALPLGEEAARAANLAPPPQSAPAGEPKAGGGE